MPSAMRPRPPRRVVGALAVLAATLCYVVGPAPASAATGGFGITVRSPGVEDSVGMGQVVFTVRTVAAQSGTCRVRVRTRADLGTATETLDYTPVDQEVQLTTSQTSFEVNVPVASDALVESDETVVLE